MKIGNYGTVDIQQLKKNRSAQESARAKALDSKESTSSVDSSNLRSRSSAFAELRDTQFLQFQFSYSESVTTISNDLRDILQEQLNLARSGGDSGKFSELKDDFSKIVSEASFEGASMFKGVFEVSLSFKGGTIDFQSPLDFRLERLGIESASVETPEDAKKAEQSLLKALFSFENQLAAQSARFMEPLQELFDRVENSQADDGTLTVLMRELQEQLSEDANRAISTQANSSGVDISRLI